jgi:hypothetical protein
VNAQPEPQTLAGARVLAQFSCYPGLIDALRDPAQALRISPGSAEFASVSGLPERYARKLLGPGKIKRLGAVSLGPILACLGTRLALVEDEEALKRVSGRLPQMDERSMRSRAVTWTVSGKKLKEWGRLGAKKRASLKLKDIARKELNKRYVRKHLAGLDEAERRRRWAAAKARQRAAKREALQALLNSPLFEGVEAT